MNIHRTVRHHFPEGCAVFRFHIFIVNFWTQVAGLKAATTAV
jgi:hypothetical protein